MENPSENPKDMVNPAESNQEHLTFDYQPTTDNHSIIKVVGVGGGGGNAVQHMYDAGINDVSFLLINTDKQALKGSSVPHTLLISDKGLGAGAKPEVAREFAMQYTEAIHNALDDGTEMVFITAGMGGGTGTGAAPIVAQIAHDMGILTVGIVTIPFLFEGRKKIAMALAGVRAIEQYCDALLVVNNNRLIDVYPDLTFGNAFGKADDTLTTAAKSISDIINKQGYINLDFADVSTTLRNGGVALISTGSASGENRLSKAIEAATTSPLLQDNNIKESRHLLFELCFSHDNPISMSEVAEMNKFVEQLEGDVEVIWGAMYDDSLGDEVRIIILASGFAMDHSTGAVFANAKIDRIVKNLQSQLSEAILAKQELLDEFTDFPEVADILNDALHQAREKVKNLTADDSFEEEEAKLDIALQRARDKKQEIIDKTIAEAERLEKKRREMEQNEMIARKRKEIEEQMAALRAMQEALNGGLATPAQDPITVTPAATVPQAAPKQEVTEVKTPVVEKEPSIDFGPAEPETVAPTPAETTAAAPAEPPVVTPAEKPITTPAEKPAVTTAEKPVVTPVEETKPADPAETSEQGPVTIDVNPTANTEEGLDQIRRYYGQEGVNQLRLSDTRKAYYVLDDPDLTNDELIALLEQLPTYNRTPDDVARLRSASRNPSQPRPAQGRPDGTIPLE